MIIKHCSLYSVIKKFNRFKLNILSISNYWLTVLTAHWRKNKSIYNIAVF